MSAFILLALPHATPLASKPVATILVRMPAAAYEEALRSDAPAAIRDASKQALDYGSFVWLEVEAPDLDSLRATGLPMDDREEPYT